MKIIIYIVITLVLFSCKSISTSTVVPTSIEKITIAPGPEDMVLDTFFTQARLIISCNSRRKNEKTFSEIMQYDLTSGETSILKRINDSTKYFNPHGIDIRKIGDEVWLYVISHNDNENKQEVITYKVYENSLVYIQTYTHPLIVSPNDIGIASDGSFYITNDAKKRNNNLEKIFAKRNSTIIYMQTQLNGETKIAAQKLAFANGILVLDSIVYISTTQLKELNKYKILANGTLLKIKNLAPIKGMDNISIYNDWLIITAHSNFLKFIKHASNSKNKSPSNVYAINRKTGECKILFSDNGKKISAASTALIYNGNIYISQVFDDFLLKVKLNEDL
ncbi:MAG: hypothetical protein ACK4IK_04845 [Bacteroidia bacterium]